MLKALNLKTSTDIVIVNFLRVLNIIYKKNVTYICLLHIQKYFVVEQIAKSCWYWLSIGVSETTNRVKYVSMDIHLAGI